MLIKWLKRTKYILILTILLILSQKYIQTILEPTILKNIIEKFSTHTKDINVYINILIIYFLTNILNTIIGNLLTYIQTRYD